MPFRNKEYKLDRTAFKTQTFGQSNDHFTYWQQKTLKERLEAAFFLIRSAYGYLDADLPPIDRTVFSTRKSGD